METNEEEKILYSSFNNDNSCFYIGTTKGFRIYNSYPLKCVIKRDINGGVSVIEVLNRCNVFAFVGTGNNIKYAQNKVILWDEQSSKVINELILRYTIKKVKLKRTKIFVICENNIIVFSLGNYEKIDSIKTFPNRNGIFGISLDPKTNIISYPSIDKGKIIIKNYDEKKKDDNYITNEINAHNSEIVALIMNYDGSLVASASIKGTIIRIFKTNNGDIIQELRRGTESAEIYCLNFDFHSMNIACSSNKGTVHIFNIKNENTNENDLKNQKSFFGNVVSYIGLKNEYLNSEWSFSKYRLPNKEKNIIGFNIKSEDSIFVVTLSGKYFHGKFDAKIVGECETSSEEDILQMEVEKNK